MPNSDQPFFAGFEPLPKAKPKVSQRGTDGFFIAARPDAAAKAQIHEAIEKLRHDHQLTARPLESENLHSTLLALGEYNGMPEGLLETAEAIAQGIESESFEVMFDHAMSFRGSGKLPLVLCGGDGVRAFSALQKQFAEKSRPFIKGPVLKTPHMTLLYSDRSIDKQRIEPVRWIVDEFVLIHSLVGKTVHNELGRWPLRPMCALNNVIRSSAEPAK